MSDHPVAVDWSLGDGEGAFLAGRYDRAHKITFAGGLTLAGSPSPAVVPAPYSRAGALDPEAAFTAALSACHMLWFLDLARQAGFVVAAYRDEAVGTLGRIGPGRQAMTRVVLRPHIAWAGARTPSAEEIASLHHRTHELCFIANSVTTKVTVEAP
jgi:organic hydroperoxide reductase OsmC/OhrA